jgi:predicted enzyme related to lactoylglutathione lyase
MGTPETRVPELGYFTLSTPDVTRAAAFYGALFGWQIPNVGPSAGGGAEVYGHVANTRLPFGFVNDMSRPSPHHFYRVDDLDAMTARVRELGGEVVEVSRYASGGNARCRDDQGVEFMLWEPAPGY